MFAYDGEFSVEHRFDPRIFNTNKYVFSIFNQMKKSPSPASFGDDHLCSDIMKFRPQISLVQINLMSSIPCARSGEKEANYWSVVYLFMLLFYSLNMVTKCK